MENLIKIFMVLGVFVLLVLGSLVFGFYNNKEEELLTSQDLVDYEIKMGRGNEIVCVGNQINTRGYDIPLCE